MTKSRSSCSHLLPKMLPLRCWGLQLGPPNPWLDLASSWCSWPAAKPFKSITEIGSQWDSMRFIKDQNRSYKFHVWLIGVCISHEFHTELAQGSLISRGRAPFRKSEAVSYHSHRLDIETLRPGRSENCFFWWLQMGYRSKLDTQIYSNRDDKLLRVTDSCCSEGLNFWLILVLTHTQIS